jgi:hypothetical protein
MMGDRVVEIAGQLLALVRLRAVELPHPVARPEPDQQREQADGDEERESADQLLEDDGRHERGGDRRRDHQGSADHDRAT